MADFGVDWQAYRHFASAVRGQNRFVPTKAIREFLDAVSGTSGRRGRAEPRGTSYWRAQLGCRWKAEVTGDENGPRYFVSYPEPRMVPHPGHVKAGGRGNPCGVAYLYLSVDRNTAIAEVRPWVGAELTLAPFVLKRDLEVVDLTLFPPPPEQISASTPSPREVEDMVWSDVNRAFSTPVGPNDSELEYVPTQYLAEYFREGGFDGLLYGSALSRGGKNLMLFDVSDAEIGAREVVRITSVNYDHQDIPKEEGRF